MTRMTRRTGHQYTAPAPPPVPPRTLSLSLGSSPPVTHSVIAQSVIEDVNEDDENEEDDDDKDDEGGRMTSKKNVSHG